MQEVVISVMASEFDNFASNLEAVLPIAVHRHTIGTVISTTHVLI